MSFWSDEEIERLKELHAEKKSSGQIARRMGFTRNKVSGKIHRLGLVAHNGRGIKEKVTRSYPSMRKLKKPPTPAEVVMQGEPEAVGPMEDFGALGTCRHIGGDPAQPGWRCCGVSTGSIFEPYCDYHKRICSVPIVKRGLAPVKIEA